MSFEQPRSEQPPTASEAKSEKELTVKEVELLAENFLSARKEYLEAHKHFLKVQKEAGPRAKLRIGFKISPRAEGEAFALYLSADKKKEEALEKFVDAVRKMEKNKKTRQIKQIENNLEVRFLMADRDFYGLLLNGEKLPESTGRKFDKKLIIEIDNLRVRGKLTDEEKDTLRKEFHKSRGLKN